MRVGYVVKRYPRFSETFVVTEILAHEAAGLDIEIFALRPSSDTHFQDSLARVRAPVHYLPGDSLRAVEFWTTLSGLPSTRAGDLGWAVGESVRDVHQAVVLADHVRERGITHLHAHFATSATAVARMAAHLSGIPYSFTAHAKDIYHETVDARDLERKLGAARAVVTVSEFNRRHLTQAWPAAADRVHGIYNGLDLDDFRFSPPTNRTPLVLGVGRLVEKKGFDDLIDACALLRSSGVAFECMIVGGGEREAELRAQIRGLELEGHVQLLGPRPRRDLLDLMREAALLAAPCVLGADGNRDGLPTVLLEAMAVGTPCVATDVTGIPEVVRNDQTGLLIRERDVRALADSIERLLGDVALRIRLAAAARQRMEEHFDIHRNAARMRTLFADDAVRSEQKVAA